MQKLTNRLAIIAMVAGALTLGGCATVESVQHAQDTADHAMSHAQSAEAAAHQAQSTADQANAKADQNAADIKTVDAKVEHLIDEERAESAGQHHRHHHHHRYALPK